jgi:hypothetical protein
VSTPPKGIPTPSGPGGGQRALVQEEFARKLFGMYTSGILTLMVDIGRRTGLFEALANGGGTSEEIAARAGLDERYVREWLGAVATGGIAQYDAARRAFTLPAEHAVCLTGPSSRNLAPGSGLLAMLARHVGGAECFRTGGGVPYSDFRPDFTDAQDASWRLLYDGLLIKGFLPAVKELPEQLEGGIRVADLGCGFGHAVNVMARQYPNSTFSGYDFDSGAIVRATAEATDMGLTNARFEVLDVTLLPEDPKFDLITTFDSIHDQRDPAAVLRAAAEPRASSQWRTTSATPLLPTSRSSREGLWTA